MAGSDPGEIEAVFRTAATRLDRERRRTVDELQALRAFEDRLRRIRPESAGASGGGVTTARTAVAGTAGKLRAVREAYEATVMSVPHYDDDYGDTYDRSVREEFGPDVGTALVRGTTFGPRCKRALLDALSRSQDERERLVAAIDDERSAIAEIPETMVPIAGQLDDLESASLPACEASVLDGYRERLRALDDRCEELAAERQRELVEQRRGMYIPSDAPDVPLYAYQGLDVNYPVLSVVASLAERVDGRLAAVERELARR